ncbi:SDR family oxidoreductase [Sphingomonas arantia]|uniref:SDR family oxidoreductase n=1 Tax=Sphingomonas arantia TaxID=1460676 RepID=A0ABW4TXT5_9SPHN
MRRCPIGRVGRGHRLWSLRSITSDLGPASACAGTGWLSQLSVVFGAAAFLPMLRDSDAAAFVVVNLLLARQPEPHMVCTSAARASVQSLVKSLSVELAPSIRVNAILLGTANFIAA